VNAAVSRSLGNASGREIVMIRVSDIEVPPEQTPLCPGCGVPTVCVRRSATIILTAPDPDPEVLVECMTSTCSRFGSRWTRADLEADVEADMTRPSWDDQFMAIARITARRATCDRSYVGCVLVVDNRIASTGYNGSFRGADHCTEVGHLMKNGKCHRTVHAEMNAVADAAARGVSIAGATAYLTREPCTMCMKLLVAADVVRIVVAEVIKEAYMSEIEWFAAAGRVDLVLPRAD
jgi:dCMP deaminase